jgi:integrase
MISNTDSMLFVYSTEHIRVKVYTGRGHPLAVNFPLGRLAEADEIAQAALFLRDTNFERAKKLFHGTFQRLWNLRRHIRPAAARCGIKKTIGWHTFRHSYATQLNANGEDVKVVPESLRHANSRITLDTYTQAVTAAKRQAQSKVVSMILPRRIQSAGAGGGR